MRFSTAPSPHTPPSNSVQTIMATVLAGLIPGVAALVWQFGPGVLVQIVIAVTVAVLSEALTLGLRKRPIVPALADLSAILTAVLLAVSLPPLSPWWMTAIGTAFAMLIGKHLYGGLGYNPFNPAMVGYAMLLISFPRYMTAWLVPVDLGVGHPGFGDTVALIFQQLNQADFDGLTQATPLDSLKTRLGLAENIDAIQASALFGTLAGKGWQWVNAGFLLGGLWLWRRGVIAWQIPAGVISSIFLTGLLFFLTEPMLFPTPAFQLFSGATMLGAFFIATDPVSAATTPRGRWIYAASIGALVVIIRGFGGYPDGMAFAVLLLNLAAPTIDHYTRPRVYGHPQ